MHVEKILTIRVASKDTLELSDVTLSNYLNSRCEHIQIAGIITFTRVERVRKRDITTQLYKAGIRP